MSNNKIYIMFLLTILSLLVGCTNKHRQSTTMEEMVTFFESSDSHNQRIVDQNKNVPPKSVTQSLIPDLDISLKPVANLQKEDRFDIAVQDAPARDFFMGLVSGTKYSMVVSPAISGTISLNLKRVTITEALNAARDAYGYEFEVTDYGFRILPIELVTRVFNVDYLNVTRTGSSNVSIAFAQISGSNSVSDSGDSGGTSGGSSVGTTTSADFWSELTTSLNLIVKSGNSNNTSVIVSPHTGVVIVKAYPNQIRDIEKFLDNAEASLSRQVILEAKIIEITLNDDFKSGVNWSYLSNKLDLTSNNSSITQAGSDGFTFVLKNQKFNNVISMLSTQGNVQVLSSPRISTVNNQKAIIKVGNDKYFVTNTSTSTTNVGTGATQNQSVNVTPFFSGISLDVTPYINKEGDVILHVHPTISDVQAENIQYTLGGKDNSIPSAASTIRESDNIVKAKSGQVIIIGGLMKTQTSESTKKTPGLGDVPLLGALFRKNEQNSEKTEVIIMLRPIVVDDNTWVKEVRNTRKRFDKLNRGFYFGGKPNIFKPSREFSIN